MPGADDPRVERPEFAGRITVSSYSWLSRGQQPLGTSVQWFFCRQHFQPLLAAQSWWQRDLRCWSAISGFGAGARTRDGPMVEVAAEFTAHAWAGLFSRRFHSAVVRGST